MTHHLERIALILDSDRLAVHELEAHELVQSKLDWVGRWRAGVLAGRVPKPLVQHVILAINNRSTWLQHTTPSTVGGNERRGGFAKLRTVLRHEQRADDAGLVPAFFAHSVPDNTFINRAKLSTN